MTFISIKHPQWRVRKWEDLDKQLRDDFTADCMNFMSNFSFKQKLVDIEVVGSYAIGCARIHSDLDINLCADDWQSQSDLIWLMLGGRQMVVEGLPSIYQEVIAFREMMMEKYKIRIEVGFRNPDSKKYVPVYSLVEQKFYNRKENEPIEAHAFWNYPSKLGWLKAPYYNKRFAVIEDPFADEVAEWQARYGDKYDPELTTDLADMTGWVESPYDPNKKCPVGWDFKWRI